ncbi:MAG TPA: HAD family hydrolase [Dehalococcoidia bacterium]|nr:HAD family hydrolase [Dehalococcoidia bacterium]
MIKAVFFDLYHTLISYEPPREKIMAELLNEFGIDITPDKLLHPINAADEFVYREHSRLPIGKRSDDEKKALWGQYQTIALKEAGIAPTRELIGFVLGKMSLIKFEPVLFDDVLPTLTDLKDKGLLLGLISNVDKDITGLLKKLGLLPLLKVVVTSLESGYNKPQPEIFREAARQGGVQPDEAVYVGDQYQIDVIGAGQAGMRGVLIDRGNHFNEDINEPKIQSLRRLFDHLS